MQEPTESGRYAAGQHLCAGVANRLRLVYRQNAAPADSRM